MAITDNSVVDAPPGDLVEPATPDEPRPEPAGLAGIVGTGDHKVLGRMWIGFSLVFGVGAFIVAAVSAWAQTQSASTNSWTADHEFQLFTASRIAGVFLFLVPLFIGIATLVVPLQVGARTIAFPRAAAAAFWVWLVGTVILITAYASGGGFGMINKDGTVNKAADLTFAGFGVVLIALLLATVCIVTTIITLRTPGMDFFRVPLFSWSMMVAGAAWLLSLPVLIGNLVLIDLDFHATAGATFGKQLGQWPQVDWVFGQPQIFAFAIPALGIMCDIVATLAKTRTPQRGVLMSAIGVFGILTIGSWAQVAFYNDLYNQILFIGISIALGLPILVLAGGWVATIRSGSLRVAGPLVLGAIGILTLLLGWLVAIAFVIKPFQLQEITTDSPPNLTSFVNTLWTQPAAQVGLTGIVVLAAATVGFAGLFYWGAKISGSRLNDGWSYVVALLVVGATLAYGPPFVVFGFANKSTGLDDSLKTLSTISMTGAGLAIAGIVVVILALLNGALSNKAAPDDPWGSGQTLEWATASPPLKANFGALDDVLSAEPLYDWQGEPAGSPDDEGDAS